MKEIDKRWEAAATSLKITIEFISSFKNCEGYEDWTQDYKEDVSKVLETLVEQENILTNPSRW